MGKGALTATVISSRPTSAPNPLRITSVLVYAFKLVTSNWSKITAAHRGFYNYVKNLRKGTNIGQTKHLMVANYYYLIERFFPCPFMYSLSSTQEIHW